MNRKSQRRVVKRRKSQRAAPKMKTLRGKMPERIERGNNSRVWIQFTTAVVLMTLRGPRDQVE